MNETAGQKAALRSDMKARRAAVPAVERANAARLAAEHVGHLLGPGEDWAVGLYHPVRDEFDALPVFERLAAQGWRPALPVVVDVDLPLEFRLWRPGERLVDGPFGIPVPTDEAARVVPDALVIPLLAFDRSGVRLGYGGGHYDRTLAQLRQAEPVIAIGLGYAFQEWPGLPVEPHDERLDWVVTPAGLWRCGEILSKQSEE